MKTNHIFKIFSVLLVAGMISSCNKDFLEEFPRLDQSDVLTLSSYEGLQSATAGSYGLLCSQNWYGAHQLVLGDLKAGNAKIGPVVSGRYNYEYFWINSASSTTRLWTDAYATIARANNVIEVVDNGFSQTGVTQDQLDNLKGENLFLRALAHWDLVRTYAQPYASGTGNPGVPVVLKTENAYPERNTVGEVYTQVVNDLLDAIDLLYETNPRGSDAAWASKWSAMALLAKVYLYMENWQAAANMATEVIDNGPFTLFTPSEYTTWDNGGYWGIGGAGSEIIFQVDVSEANDNHPWWESFSYLVDPYGYGDICTSEDLLNLYEAGDVRADLFQEPPEYPGFFWTLKYPGRQGQVPRRSFNLPLLRLAEMYLIRAEALLEGASIAGESAQKDYNTLRAQRGLAAAGSVSLQDIYNERRRELCFEGNTLFDLARTQRSLDRTDYDGATNEDVAFIPGGTPEQNFLWAMPIPQAEIDANVNMDQNAGY